MEYLDSELEELARSNLKISEENNKLLRKIWRDVKYKRIMKFVYWIIIIGVSFGSYYYAQPYIEKMVEIYTGINKKIQTTGNTLNLVNKEAKTSLDTGIQSLDNAKKALSDFFQEIHK